jgi:hypothetical protein
LKRELVVRGGGIVFLQHASEDASRSEQGQGTRQASRLAREGRLETFLGDILVIRI